MDVETLMIQSALGNWNLTINRLNRFFSALSSEDYFQEIAPGKNRILYVLGHLAAVHDRTQEILGISKRLHPELEARLPCQSRSGDRTSPQWSRAVATVE